VLVPAPAAMIAFAGASHGALLDHPKGHAGGLAALHPAVSASPPRRPLLCLQPTRISPALGPDWLDVAHGGRLLHRAKAALR
jgi:hypothetical protein